MQLVQAFFNSAISETGVIKIKDHAHDFGSLWHDTQRPAAAVQLKTLIAIRRDVADEASFTLGCIHAGGHAAADHAVLLTRHEQAEFHPFLVRLLRGVVNFGRRDNQRARELERLGDDALIDRIAARQTRGFCDEDALPASILHLGEKLLHDRTVRNALAGDDLAVNCTDRQGAGLGKLHQDMLVPGEGIALAVHLGFEIRAGFAEIQGVVGGHGITPLGLAEIAEFMMRCAVDSITC